MRGIHLNNLCILFDEILILIHRNFHQKWSIIRWNQTGFWFEEETVDYALERPLNGKNNGVCKCPKKNVLTNGIKTWNPTSIVL